LPFGTVLTALRGRSRASLFAKAICPTRGPDPKAGFLLANRGGGPCDGTTLHHGGGGRTGSARKGPGFTADFESSPS
jgi:hypothetical protein